MARFVGPCWKCGELWEGDSQPGRGDACPRCDFDFHSCLNCKHHDSRYRNECRIPESDRIKDRDRANFCDYFEIHAESPDKGAGMKAEETQSKLDKLFGGG